MCPMLVLGHPTLQHLVCILFSTTQAMEYTFLLHKSNKCVKSTHMLSINRTKVEIAFGRAQMASYSR